MKGAAHFHSLTAEDNLVLKQAQNVNKLVSEVRSWIDLLSRLRAACTNILGKDYKYEKLLFLLPHM